MKKNLLILFVISFVGNVCAMGTGQQIKKQKQKQNTQVPGKLPKRKVQIAATKEALDIDDQELAKMLEELGLSKKEKPSN